MKTQQIVKILEHLCPTALAPFETNGFLRKSPKEINVKKLSFTLGFSQESIYAAILNKSDMLVIHNAPDNLAMLEDTYYTEIKKAIDNTSLSIYKLHLPLDFSPHGIISQLSQLMGFRASPTQLIYENHKILGGVYVAHGNYTLNEILQKVRRIKPATIRIVPGKSKEIKTVAITSGDGCKPEFLLQLKPDVFICGLLNQESIRIAHDLKITLIEATSYATENGPLKRFVKQNKNLFKKVKVDFIDIKNEVNIIERR